MALVPDAFKSLQHESVVIKCFFLLSAVFPRGDRHDLCTGLVLSSECNFSFFQYLYIFNERISLGCFPASLLSCFLLLIFILKSKAFWPVVSTASFSFFLCDTYIASWPHAEMVLPLYAVPVSPKPIRWIYFHHFHPLLSLFCHLAL